MTKVTTSLIWFLNLAYFSWNDRKIRRDGKVEERINLYFSLPLGWYEIRMEKFISII